MWNYEFRLKFRAKIKEQFVTYDINKQIKGNKISPSAMKNVSISSGVKYDDPARNDE